MTAFFILHGSSSVGKTYLMSKIVDEVPGVVGLEMDDSKYWRDYDPEFDQDTIALIAPKATAEDRLRFLELYEGSNIKRKRSTAFLVAELARLDLEVADFWAESKVVIATCGALPPPPHHSGEASIYEWLERELPLSFFHLLIEVPEDVHLERMARRGRLHLKDEILDNYSRRVAMRSGHDEVISGYDELVAFVSENVPGFSPAPAEPASD